MRVRPVATAVPSCRKVRVHFMECRDAIEQLPVMTSLGRDRCADVSAGPDMSPRRPVRPVGTAGSGLSKPTDKTRRRDRIRFWTRIVRELLDRGSMNTQVLCGGFSANIGLKSKGLRRWSVTPCLSRSRGLDLNQRPLGYESTADVSGAFFGTPARRSARLTRRSSPSTSGSTSSSKASRLLSGGAPRSVRHGAPAGRGGAGPPERAIPCQPTGFLVAAAS